MHIVSAQFWRKGEERRRGEEKEDGGGGGGVGRRDRVRGGEGGGQERGGVPYQHMAEHVHVYVPAVRIRVDITKLNSKSIGQRDPLTTMAHTIWVPLFSRTLKTV